MKLTYTQYGDYLIPNLVLSDTREYHIGKYGWMRRVYLKDHRPALYSILLLTGKTLSPIWQRSTLPAKPGWTSSRLP